MPTPATSIPLAMRCIAASMPSLPAGSTRSDPMAPIDMPFSTLVRHKRTELETSEPHPCRNRVLRLWREAGIETPMRCRIVELGEGQQSSAQLRVMPAAVGVSRRATKHNASPTRLAREPRKISIKARLEKAVCELAPALYPAGAMTV